MPKNRRTATDPRKSADFRDQTTVNQITVVKIEQEPSSKMELREY